MIKMNDKRTFKVIHVAKPGQDYKSTKFDKESRAYGTTPLQAAKKLFGEICASKKIKSRCTLSVTIKEVTRGSDGKIYSYRLKRVKKDKPDIVTFPGGKEVKFEYDIEVSNYASNTKKSKSKVLKGRPMVSSKNNKTPRKSIFDSLI